MTNKELQKQYERETGERHWTNPVCHGELGFASWEYQKWLEEKIISSPVEAMVKPVACGQWIGVKEKLPDYGIDVLCYDEDFDKIIIARISRGLRGHFVNEPDKWFRDGFGNYSNQEGIIKWTQLPSKPSV